MARRVRQEQQGTRPTDTAAIPTTRRDVEGYLPPWYNKPGQLRQEYMVSQALAVASIPDEQLRKIRPQVPQAVDPPRLGYDDRPWTVEDILLTDRLNPTRRAWVSGAGIMLQRSSLTDDQWSGGTRNSQMSANPAG